MSGVRYPGKRLRGLEPLETLLPSHAMWAVSAETLTAALFLREGLRSLDLYLTERQDFYPGALQLLGQGLEHLLKLTFILAKLRTEGSPPAPDDMKRLGHALPRLRDEVVAQLLHPSLVAVSDGEGFVRSAWVLQASSVNDYLLSLLEDHGQGTRYFYLEAILGRRSVPDPHDAFQRWFDEIAEASRELYEGGEEDEFSPLQLHLLWDRPAAYRRERNEIVYMHLLGFLNVTASVLLWLRADGWEGPLRPLTRIRTLRRPPKGLAG